MNVSTINSPPLTPAAAGGALVQAGKVERNAANGLVGASSDVIPTIQAIAQTADQTSRNDSAVTGAANRIFQQAPPPRPAQLNFSANSQIAPTAKG